jgi:hypothetical protein
MWDVRRSGATAQLAVANPATPPREPPPLLAEAPRMAHAPAAPAPLDAAPLAAPPAASAPRLGRSKSSVLERGPLSPLAATAAAAAAAAAARSLSGLPPRTGLPGPPASSHPNAAALPTTATAHVGGVALLLYGSDPRGSGEGLLGGICGGGIAGTAAVLDAPHATCHLLSHGKDAVLRGWDVRTMVGRELGAAVRDAGAPVPGDTTWGGTLHTASAALGGADGPVVDVRPSGTVYGHRLRQPVGQRARWGAVVRGGASDRESLALIPVGGGAAGAAVWGGAIAGAGDLHAPLAPGAGDVAIVSLGSGELVGVLRGHIAPVAAVVATHSDGAVWTAGGDGLLLRWCAGPAARPADEDEGMGLVG